MPTRSNVRELCRIAGQWKPQLDVIRGIREVLWHDAHDRARNVVHDHLSADGVRVAVKVLLPDAVRQHDDSIRARPVLARRERSPERRADAHDVEEVRRDPRSARADGGLAWLGSAKDSVVEAPRRHTIEGARVALVEHDAGVRLVHRRGAGVADGMPEAHEAVRFREGQRLEQDAVHEAEHGRRRADAEGEHEDDRCREARGASKAARREPKLRPGREHPSEVYLPPHLCFKQGRPPLARRRNGTSRTAEPRRRAGRSVNGRRAAALPCYRAATKSSGSRGS